MVVSTSVVARRYEDVSAGTPISVDIPAYEMSDVYVYYGNASLVAVQGTDYTVALAGDFETFTVTPTASLLTKINALIAADATEENFITVRRTLDYLTDATPDGVRYTPFTSREFDRNAMRDMQLADKLKRTLSFPEAHLAEETSGSVVNVQPGQIIRRNDDGNGFSGAEMALSVTEVDAWFQNRDVTSATQAALLTDGSVVMLNGRPYKVDSSATGLDSATNDLGVDGIVATGRVSPHQFGSIGDGADDQVALKGWLHYAVKGVPAVLDCVVRQGDEVTVHPASLTATATIDITATNQGRIEYVGATWIYRMIHINLDGNDCFADFGFVDGGDNAAKGIHLSNGVGAGQDNTVRVSCEGKNFRVLASGSNGYQTGVMSFSGGCEHFIVDRWRGENVSAAAGNLDALQMFVISADEANAIGPKHIRIKDHYSHNIKADDYITRASSDADGLVIFGYTQQVEGSCVIEHSLTSEICGRGLKLAHKFAVVKYQKDYRSIQGHTATAGIGATSCAFQYGTGVHENLEAVFVGPNVFNKNADVLVTYTSQSDVQPSVRARREVGSISVTCKDTGVTNGLWKLVDFRGGHTMTDDLEYTSVLKSAVMSGGFCHYALGVRSSGYTDRPQHVFASNIKAKIDVAFAAADAFMLDGKFHMHLHNVHNTKGSNVPTLVRTDAVDMIGRVGFISGSGQIQGIERSKGVHWNGLAAGYAPDGAKFRLIANDRVVFDNAKMHVFDEEKISSADGTLTSPCRFPCEILAKLDFGAAIARFAVDDVGNVTEIYNTNTTHLQGNGLSEPASGTYRLWTTFDYPEAGGTIHFKTTDGTPRYFEIIADM